MRILCTFLLAMSMMSYGQSLPERAKNLYDEKKYDEASKLLKEVEEDDTDYAAAQYYLGRIAFDQRRYDDAVDYFEVATDANPTSAEYFSWLGDAYGTVARDANPFRQGLLAPKMRSAWERAISLDPRNIDARKSLVQFYIEAPGLMGGSFEKAHKVADELIKLSPSEGHRSKGNAYARENKIVEAEKEYQTMAGIDPRLQFALANFYVNQKEFDKAFSIYVEEMKKNPANMITMYQLGRVSAISGQELKRGEECLKKYLTYQPKQNEPTHAGANMRLGQIYEKQGKKPEARKFYETALSLDKSLKEAKEGLQRTSQ